MREILFRGKRTDNGKWVEGFYSAEEYNPNIRKIEYIPRIQIIGKCVSLGVLPETVGQFIGEVDKNGHMIFEGDIVKFKDTLFEIKYIQKYQRFAPVRPNTVFAVFNLKMAEIIGNVHDNPELLTGGNENGHNDIFACKSK